MVNHILEEYKQRFLANTDYVLTSFKLMQEILFNNIIRNGESRPCYTEFMDEVTLEVEFEVTGVMHPDPYRFSDRNFHLMSWETSVNMYDRLRTVHTYSLRYIIRKN